MPILVFALSPGCRKAESASSDNAPVSLASNRVGLAKSFPDGLSGLTGDARGRLYAIAENAAAIAIMGTDGKLLGVRKIRGIPPGLETESIALLPNGSFAVGTESNRPGRVKDDILIVDALAEAPSALAVRDSVELNYGPWSQRCEPNEGIEGLCCAGGWLVAVGETVLVRGGQRSAPIAFRRVSTLESTPASDAVWIHGRLLLTSKTGKIAGLDCRETGSGGIEFVAIERHFEVRRLLHWVVQKVRPGQAFEPHVFFDFDDSSLNTEGITWSPSGALNVITDNYFRGGRHGDSVLFRLAASAESKRVN